MGIHAALWPLGVGLKLLRIVCMIDESAMRYKTDNQFANCCDMALLFVSLRTRIFSERCGPCSRASHLGAAVARSRQSTKPAHGR